MAMDVGGAKGGIKSDINVTPLVDVMLVLLIIMMIVAPLLQKGADVKLPVAAYSSDKPETQDQTVVAVDSPLARAWISAWAFVASVFASRTPRPRASPSFGSVFGPRHMSTSTRMMMSTNSRSTGMPRMVHATAYRDGRAPRLRPAVDRLRLRP